MQAMQGEMEWPQLFATSRRMNPMTLATGTHLDITLVCCATRKAPKSITGIAGRSHHIFLDEYGCYWQREECVCVCVFVFVKPTTPHVGKSFDIEVSDQVYMFSTGAGCPRKCQPNEEVCSMHMKLISLETSSGVPAETFA